MIRNLLLIVLIVLSIILDCTKQPAKADLVLVEIGPCEQAGKYYKEYQKYKQLYENALKACGEEKFNQCLKEKDTTKNIEQKSDIQNDSTTFQESDFDSVRFSEEERTESGVLENPR